MHVPQGRWSTLLALLRGRGPGRRTLAFATLLVPAAAVAVAPAVVSWQAADGHVGSLVAVEGDVVAAYTTGDACVLEFAPDDPRAFRVVLLVPLLSGLPRQPELLYLGKRVQASGRVQRFGGRPEMVLRNPDQIVIVDVAGGAPSPTAAVETPPRAAQPPAPAPTVPPPPDRAPATAAPVEAPAPSPRGLAEAVREQIAPRDPCAHAHERWREAAATITDRSLTLRRCLDALGYRCRAEAAAIAPALAALEWAEQQVEAACP